MKQAELKAESRAIAEQSYDQLNGDWLDWLEVAKRYEHKVPSQDRGDIRHSIILELALARAKTSKPIPLYRAYRIASYMVADYWRQRQKLNTGLDCKNCSKTQRARCKEDNLYSQCPKLIKLVSLDTLTVDADGNPCRVIDTVADDKAIDLDLWLDINTFLLGCPTRLLELAVERLEGKPLNDTDQRYFTRQRAKERKRYQQKLL